MSTVYLRKKCEYGDIDDIVSVPFVRARELVNLGVAAYSPEPEDHTVFVPPVASEPINEPEAASASEE